MDEMSGFGGGIGLLVLILIFLFGFGGTNTNFYIEMAKSFLMDKDAPKGKVLRYYLAMKM